MTTIAQKELIKRLQAALFSEEKTTLTKIDRKPFRWNRRMPSWCKWNRINKRKNWKRNKTCYTINNDSPWLLRLIRTTLNSNSETELLTKRIRMRILLGSKWDMIPSTRPRFQSKIRINKSSHGPIQQPCRDLRITSLNRCSNNE